MGSIGSGGSDVENLVELRLEAVRLSRLHVTHEDAPNGGGGEDEGGESVPLSPPALEGRRLSRLWVGRRHSSRDERSTLRPSIIGTSGKVKALQGSLIYCITTVPIKPFERLTLRTHHNSPR